jgi:hypothetical protein
VCKHDAPAIQVAGATVYPGRALQASSKRAHYNHIRTPVTVL